MMSPHLLGLGLQEPQAGQDVVGGISNVVLHLHVKVELEVEGQAELDQDLKGPEGLASQTMLSGPHEH